MFFMLWPIFFIGLSKLPLLELEKRPTVTYRMTFNLKNDHFLYFKQVFRKLKFGMKLMFDFPEKPK